MRLFVAEFTGLVTLQKVVWAAFSHMSSNVHRNSGRYFLLCLGTDFLRYLWGAPGFHFSLLSLASVLRFDWPLSDLVCYFVERFLLLLLLLLLFCTFSFVYFAGLVCSCHEAAVTGRPGCWFPLLCNTWENSSLSDSTGESNSLQLRGHLPEYITCWKVLGFFVCLFLPKTLL